MRVDRELRPLVQLLFDNFSRRFRHQAERISSQVNERLAILADRQVKFFAEMIQRILGIELFCEFFVSGEGQGHKSAANVQRSTLNVQRSIQKSAATCHLLNTQLATINRFEMAAA